MTLPVNSISSFLMGYQSTKSIEIVEKFIMVGYSVMIQGTEKIEYLMVVNEQPKQMLSIVH